MNRQEMLEYLAEGYPPMLVSYWKWVDIAADVQHTNPHEYQSDTCALCKTFELCNDCPLTEINQCCEASHSVWHCFDEAWHDWFEFHEPIAHAENAAIVMAMTLRALCKMNNIDTGD